jgi:hypothetical protein
VLLILVEYIGSRNLSEKENLSHSHHLGSVCIDGLAITHGGRDMKTRKKQRELASYILLIVDMFRPHTAIFRCYSILSRKEKKTSNMAAAKTTQLF